jgi:hypothetical protein
MFADAKKFPRYIHRRRMGQSNSRTPLEAHSPRGREPEPVSHLGQRGRGGARVLYNGKGGAHNIMGRTSRRVTASRNIGEMLWTRGSCFSTDSGNFRPRRSPRHLRHFVTSLRNEKVREFDRIP